MPGTVVRGHGRSVWQTEGTSNLTCGLISYDRVPGTHKVTTKLESSYSFW